MVCAATAQFREAGVCAARWRPLATAAAEASLRGETLSGRWARGDRTRAGAGGSGTCWPRARGSSADRGSPGGVSFGGRTADRATASAALGTPGPGAAIGQVRRQRAKVSTRLCLTERREHWAYYGGPVAAHPESAAGPVHHLHHLRVDSPRLPRWAVEVLPGPEYTPHIYVGRPDRLQQPTTQTRIASRKHERGSNARGGPDRGKEPLRDRLGSGVGRKAVLLRHHRPRFCVPLPECPIICR